MCTVIVGHCVCCQLEVELCRCRDLQRQNLRQVIDVARDEVQQLWTQCYISLDERQAFSYNLARGQLKTRAGNG